MFKLEYQCPRCGRFYRKIEAHKKKYGCNIEDREEKIRKLKEHYEFLDKHPEVDGRRNVWF